MHAAALLSALQGASVAGAATSPGAKLLTAAAGAAFGSALTAALKAGEATATGSAATPGEIAPYPQPGAPSSPVFTVQTPGEVAASTSEFGTTSDGSPLVIGSDLLVCQPAPGSRIDPALVMVAAPPLTGTLGANVESPPAPTASVAMLSKAAEVGAESPTDAPTPQAGSAPTAPVLESASSFARPRATAPIEQGADAPKADPSLPHATGGDIESVATPAPAGQLAPIQPAEAPEPRGKIPTSGFAPLLSDDAAAASAPPSSVTLPAPLAAGSEALAIAPPAPAPAVVPSAPAAALAQAEQARHGAAVSSGGLLAARSAPVAARSPTAAAAPAANTPTAASTPAVAASGAEAAAAASATVQVSSRPVGAETSALVGGPAVQWDEPGAHGANTAQTSPAVPAVPVAQAAAASLEARNAPGVAPERSASRASAEPALAAAPASAPALAPAALPSAPASAAAATIIAAVAAAPSPSNPTLAPGAAGVPLPPELASAAVVSVRAERTGAGATAGRSATSDSPGKSVSSGLTEPSAHPATPVQSAKPEVAPTTPRPHPVAGEAVPMEVAEGAPEPVATELRSVEAAATQAGAAAQAREGPLPVRGSPETMASLAAEIARKLDGRNSKFEIQLDPLGLGVVNVSIDIGADGKLSAQMAFERPEAAAELRGRGAELQRALEQAGFDLSRGGLSFEHGQGRERPGGDQPRGQHARAHAFQQALLAADAADSLPAQPLRLRDRARGLDVRI